MLAKHRDEILRLRAEGATYKQIQEKLGCSKGTISYHLGAGQKQKVIQRTRNRRNKIREFVQMYKQEHPCADCGEDYPYWMKDFDHVRGEKAGNVSQILATSINLDAILAEIEKCEVVCANCHRNRTHLRSLTTGEWALDVGSFYDV